MLVRWIRQGAELGRTSDVRSFDRYFEGESSRAAMPLMCLPQLKKSRGDDA